MSEQNAETPDQNIDADQVVVNNAPDGGGVDNENQAAPEAQAESDTEPDPASGQEN